MYHFIVFEKKIEKKKLRRIIDKNLIIPFHYYKRNVLLPFEDKTRLTKENKA